MESTLKILVCGEGGVGKTSFLNRYIHDVFDENSKITKGVQFFCKNIDVNDEDCNYSADLSLWDFSGQDHFRFIFPNFVKGAKGAFFLFDLTRMSTLDRIEEWFKMLEVKRKIPILVLGSKDDLIESEQCELFDECASQIIEAHENCIDYIKISSKTGSNVKEAFHLLVKKIIQKIT